MGDSQGRWNRFREKKKKDWERQEAAKNGVASPSVKSFQLGKVGNAEKRERSK